MSNQLLMIDDDKELCALIQKSAEQEGLHTEVAYTGADGLSRLKKKKERFALVVLDVMLPGMNGFQVLAEIRRISDVPVLMLTAKSDEADKVSGLRMGADDYLTKPFSLNELLARIQSLIRRYIGFGVNADLAPIEIGVLCIDPAGRTVTSSGQAVDLTGREFDLLLFLAKHRGQVFTKKQIYTQVWQDDYAFDDNNIMSFISKLRKKIELDAAQPAYIQTIRGVGYRFMKE